MAISAINSNSSLLPRPLAQAKSHDVASSSQNKIANADGDTLKLSATSQNVAAKTSVYTQPKPANNGATDNILKPAHFAAVNSAAKTVSANIKK